MKQIVFKETKHYLLFMSVRYVLCGICTWTLNFWCRDVGNDWKKQLYLFDSESCVFLKINAKTNKTLQLVQVVLGELKG